MKSLTHVLKFYTEIFQYLGREISDCREEILRNHGWYICLRISGRKMKNLISDSHDFIVYQTLNYMLSMKGETPENSKFHHCQHVRFILTSWAWVQRTLYVHTTCTTKYISSAVSLQFLEFTLTRKMKWSHNSWVRS